MSDTQVTLQWLAEIDSTDLSARADDVARALRTLLKQPRDTSDEAPTRSPDRDLESAIDHVLRSCAEVGPGSLSTAAAKSLAFPALRLADAQSLWPGLGDALRACKQRADLTANLAIRSLIDQGLSRVAVEPISAVVIPLTDDDISSIATAQGMQDAIGRSGAEATAQAWSTRRRQVAEQLRWPRDAQILIGLMTPRSRIPAELAEQLYVEQCWADDEMQRWVHGIARPLDPEESGAAAAVLLNARIREQNSRIFLPYPTTVLARPMTGQEAGEDLTVGAARDVARPVSSCLLGIRGELARTTPRKRALASVEQQLKGLLHRFGLEEYPGVESSDNVSFDSALHLGDGRQRPSGVVRVVSPGVRFANTSEVLIKAKVVDAESNSTIASQDGE